MKLVIVESPAKCKKIEGFLGSEYCVCASYGHFRDLKTGMKGIDFENNFSPRYEIKKHAVVKTLRERAKTAEEVIIASDMDREGEAIGFHIAEVLKLDPKTTKRIVFNQITKTAIDSAIANPRILDENLFYAQQARRVLDRIIGFSLSPILWKYVASKLSAGRCQSPALGLVFDKEKEIEQFFEKEAKTSFLLTGLFSPCTGYDEKFQFTAVFCDKINGSQDALRVFKQITHTSTIYTLTEKTFSDHSSAAPPPFTTSSLQQVASSKGISPRECMRIAQKLYEAGLITYMRTDSKALSPSFLVQCKAFVTKQFGASYHNQRVFSSRKDAQNAHEAIRPVYIDRENIGGKWCSRSTMLYSLIRKRSLGTQMKSKKSIRCRLTITATVLDGKEVTYLAFADTPHTVFDGWTRLYEDGSSFRKSREKNDELWKFLCNVPIMIPFHMHSCSGIQKYNQPPKRFTQAQLIQKLEQKGIGRPSTFSSILTTIVERQYVSQEKCNGVEKESLTFLWDERTADDQIRKSVEIVKLGEEKTKRLHMSDLGNAIVFFLRRHFQDIMDYSYTSKLEEKLDKISHGDLDWTACVRDIYENIEENKTRIAAKASDTPIKKLSLQKRCLGKHPKSAMNIYIFIGKKGKVIQHGESDDKNTTFSIYKTKKKVEDITLDTTVLDLLPRNVGDYDGFPVILRTGPFGKYIEWNGKKISLKPDEKLADVKDIARVITSTQKKQRIVSGTGKNTVYCCEGPYGFYVRKGKTLRSLPTELDWQTVTSEQCNSILKQPKRKRKQKRKQKRKKTEMKTETKMK